jgi:hypothetical protein
VAKVLYFAIYIYVCMCVCVCVCVPRQPFGKFSKTLSHLKENRFEVVKILRGFGGGFVAFFFLKSSYFS